MKAVNLQSGAQRNTEAGMLWREVISAGAGTIVVPHQRTIRVDAVADTTVTIGGELVMTVRANQVERINVGLGIGSTVDDGKRAVTVVIAGSAYVQVSVESDKEARRTP